MLKSKQETMKDVGKVMRHKIDIEKKTDNDAVDAVGNQVEAWSHWRYFWIEANGLHGVEYYAAASANEENTVEMSLRYCKDLDSLNTIDYRVVFNGKTYDIKAVDPVKYEDRWVNLKLMERGINGS